MRYGPQIKQAMSGVSDRSSKPEPHPYHSIGTSASDVNLLIHIIKMQGIPEDNVGDGHA